MELIQFIPIYSIETNMEHQLLQVFTRCPNNPSQHLPSNQFHLSCHGVRHQVGMAIGDGYVVLTIGDMDDGVVFATELDFGLKFQVIRQQWPDHLTPGIPIGIRFDRDNQGVSLYSNPQVVDSCTNLLQTKINQRNFHQLFKAKRKMGKGAFATVYLAHALVDQQMVAVKAFSKQKQFSTKNGKQALINEIQILRYLNHPNLTKLYGIYETQNSVYMVLESLEGGQLNQRIKNQRISQHDRKLIIKNLLSGLSYLASKKIIHRDIKPENIIFKSASSTDLVLCDYGLATRSDEEHYLFVRCGTPGFVAPEIINIKDMSTKSGPISDVFSAGVIFHHLLFGTSIFTGQKYNDILGQNRQCSFNFNHPKYHALDPKAKELLSRMLEVNPNLRITAEDALKHEYFGNVMVEERLSFSCLDNLHRRFSNVYQSPKSMWKENQIKKGSCWKESRMRMELSGRY